MSSAETETGAVAPAADGGTEAETGTDAPDAAIGPGVGTTEAAEADGTDGVDADEVETGAVASEVVDVVEIPKQQSAEAAADNEAGEGARQ
ncbi:hypothetical protein [Streptomyces sp. NBC_00691]|uniref:hypothetical protein n=1 Tax=Streptomyces sp. NBC_00691 TaxID=2903671 RepID=UPI003FA78D4C